jgi:Bacterial Ig domain
LVNRFVTAALLLCALSAGADAIRIARPRFHEVSPAPDTFAAPGGVLPNAATAPECLNAQGAVITCAVDMQYFGGPVLSNVKVYAVFWSSAVSPVITQGMGGFYGTLSNSEWVDWLTEYSTNITVQAGSHQGGAGTEQVIGRGSFAGNYTLPVLSMTYPACTSPNQLLTCVTDEDIQGEIDWQIRHGNLPLPDANTLYMVHFPSSVEIEVGSRPVATSCQAFCSYHSTYQGTYQNGVPQDVFYAAIPDLGSNHCEAGCGQGSTLQNTCMVTSHEIAESITDSAVGLVMSADYPLGWYDTEPTTQGEVADMCNQHTDTLDVNGFPGCDAADAGCYTVQQVFSHVVWNADSAGHPNTEACVTTRFDANDYSLAFSPNALTLAPGGTSAAIPVVTSLTNGNPQPLTLSVTALPSGLHASLDTSSVRAGATAHLTVSADADAPPFRDGVLVVRATGATTHSAALLVQLSVAQNDWNLYLSPATAVLLPGTSQVYTVGGQVTLGAAETVTLATTVSGLPAGVTASFSASTLVPGTSTSQLTLSASPGAPGAPPTPFTVTGSSASQPGGHSGSAVVRLDTPPTVAITSPTAGATVSGVVEVQVAATPGANSSIAHITISIDNEPPLSAGLTGSVSWDTRGVANGSHSIQTTVLNSDQLSASASVNVTVANAFSDFTLSAAPDSVVVPVGGNAHLTVTTSVVAGAAEPIALTFTGLPPGVSASLVPALVTAGATSTVTFITPSGTPTSPPTSATLRGTTASQPQGHTIAVTISVQPQAPPSSGGCASTDTRSPSPWLLFLLLTALHRGRRPAHGTR